ncbi:MAG: GRP family sugar transporter [Acidobacteriaceae bacterium]|jgi:glucose uptake protein
MITVHSYPIAVALCVLTMFCWGSWANTLKMEPRSYGFGLFYWDQAIGYLLLPLLLGLTFGSMGTEGRSLIADLRQANANSYAWAIFGGVVFNLANILFMAALDLAGMAVAYPIAIGIALVEGVLVNYIAQPRGNPLLIFGGVALIMLAIILDGFAYRACQGKTAGPGEMRKGIFLAVSGGILMGLFYFLVQRSVSMDFTHLAPGKFGPYAAVLIYSAGSCVSNLVFNTWFMAHPVKGQKVTYSDYFSSGTMKYHLIGMLGGVINGIGVTSNFVASKAASPAIAYGLGQGGTMIAAIWGVCVWKETKGATRGTQVMIGAMFLFFLSGLILLVTSMLH